MRQFAPILLLCGAVTVAAMRLAPERSNQPGQVAAPITPAKRAGERAAHLERTDDTWERETLKPGAQEFLIATLPDPVESSSGYRFDMLVDAIQRAIETQSYVLDNYSYPWKTGTKASEPPTTRITLDSIGSRGPAPPGWPGITVHSEEPDERCYRRKPGILVFRRTNDCLPKRLVLFLVGETATKGIHQRALKKAFECISTCRGDAAAGPIRIVGPFFSGSHQSLVDIIRGWQCCNSQTRFRIISGSATALSDRELADFPNRSVTFQTTVHQEEILRKVLLKYLRVDPDAQRVAILVESNTSFGRRVSQLARKGSGAHIHVPFPLHISATRTAYGWPKNRTGITAAATPVLVRQAAHTAGQRAARAPGHRTHPHPPHHRRHHRGGARADALHNRP